MSDFMNTALKCDGCFHIDADTTHNCRQRNRHDCADNLYCPDIVEKCQCTTCED